MFATLLPRVTNHLKEVANTFGFSLDEARAVLRDICFGAYETGRPGAAYYHVFEGVVALVGRRLPSSALEPMSPSSVAALDDQLGLLGASVVSLQTFLGHSLPIELPAPHDLPRAGFATEESVAHAHEVFASVEVRDDATVAELREWFRIAAEHRRGIVAFYY